MTSATEIEQTLIRDTAHLNEKARNDIRYALAVLAPAYSNRVLSTTQGISQGNLEIICMGADVALQRSGIDVTGMYIDDGVDILMKLGYCRKDDGTLLLTEKGTDLFAYVEGENAGTNN
ncbi:hypothetical protein HYX10_04220 [Candidatus Woesearchaeota archaeon]|nr:hypothetical protein [Candidatus Woesearchaeota archaeon]